MRSRSFRSAVPGLVLGAGVLLTIISAASAHSVGRRQEALAFAHTADNLQRTIESRLDAYIAMLRGGAGLFAASDHVDLAEFRAYVGRLELPVRYPGIQGIGFSRVVRPEEREELRRTLLREGVPSFHYWPDQPDDAVIHAIIYLEPLDARNLVALGYDMFSQPIRRAAMERARDHAEPAASGRVRLVQERAEPGREQYGFLIYMPVYEGGVVPGTVEERRRQLEGFVYSPFRADDLLGGVLGSELERGIHLEVYDGLPEAGLLMHRSSTPVPGGGHRARRHVVVAGRPWVLEFRAVPTGGIEFRDVFVLVIAVGGVLLSALLFNATRTEMRAREDAEHRAAVLRESEEALRAAHRAKDDFLAVVSHELRTPLNAILGWSSMLMKGQVPASGQSHALETIYRNAKVQVKLVEDLLDLSRAVAGRLRLELQETDVAAVLHAALTSAQPAADAARVRLEWQGAPDLGSIQADPARVEQIVSNLVGNGIKFTASGGVVRLSAWRDWRHIVLEVRDSGMGIPRDLLPHIFDPFRQGDTSSTRAHSGAGLGLSIARHLVELHGGTIGASSPGEGQGATFIVRLPVEPPAQPARAALQG